MVILLCYQYFIKEKNYTIREIRYVVHNFPTSNCLIWTISFCSGELNHGISVVITSLLSFYFLFFSSIFNLHSIHCCHRVPGGVEIKEESITHSRGLVQSRNILKKIQWRVGMFDPFVLFCFLSHTSQGLLSILGLFLVGSGLAVIEPSLAMCRTVMSHWSLIVDKFRNFKFMIFQFIEIMKKIKILLKSYAASFFQRGNLEHQKDVLILCFLLSLK